MTTRARILILLGVFLMTTLSAMAGNFVSLNGKFFITYPDTWHQIDYTSIDYFLYKGKPSDNSFQYEAAFAPKASMPWYSDAYLVLTVDTLPNLSQKQIDSVLQNLSGALGKPMQTASKADLVSNLQPGQLVYNDESKTGAAILEVASKRPGDKTSLIFLRFYDGGVANFYFYSPDSTLAKNMATFTQITSSLSTENIEAAMPRETLKVADADKIEHRETEPSRRPAMWIPTSGALVIIIVIALMARRRRAAKSGK